jgi:hypothetical protein
MGPVASGNVSSTRCAFAASAGLGDGGVDAPPLMLRIHITAEGSHGVATTRFHAHGTNAAFCYIPARWTASFSC